MIYTLLSNAQRPRYAIVRLCAALLLVATTLATTVAANAATSENSPAAQNLLDGMEFRAGITRNGADLNSPLEDLLVFRDGQFSSVMCARYNFSAAPYWTRVEDGRTQFRVELSCPTDGTMTWQGTIENGVLDGTMRWTRARWYWTIEAEHSIRGEAVTTTD